MICLDKVRILYLNITCLISDDGWWTGRDVYGNEGLVPNSLVKVCIKSSFFFLSPAC